jgi:hypothetical protein
MRSWLKSSPLLRKTLGWTCVVLGVVLAIPLVPGPGIPLILVGLGLLGKGGKTIEKLKSYLTRKSSQTTR